ncbi:MAG: hypothetical protein ACK448_08985 [Bacteroidota bacterium]
MGFRNYELLVSVVRLVIPATYSSSMLGGVGTGYYLPVDFF